jgi:hypothetical protein
MFTLNNETVRLANINTRTEKHGDDDVLACDIKLEASLANAVLSKFSDSLKEVLYTKDDGAVEDLINPDHAQKLRNPLMGPIKWNLDMPSVQFRIHHGENDDDDIVFSAAKANKFQFLCQEGGTVTVDFRVQVSEPDEEEVTKLLFMLNKSVKVSLINEIEAPDESDDTGPDMSVGPDLLSELAPSAGKPDAGLQTESQHADEYDALYSKAVTFVKELNKASISMVKRELKVTPLVAARLLTQMEEEGIVGPAAGNGLRDVLGIAA